MTENQVQDPPNKKRKILYEALKDVYNLGTEEEFNIKLDNPQKRNAFYKHVSRDYNLGTEEEFNKKVGSMDDLYSETRKGLAEKGKEIEAAKVEPPQEEVEPPQAAETKVEAPEAVEENEDAPSEFDLSTPEGIIGYNQKEAVIEQGKAHQEIILDIQSRLDRGELNDEQAKKEYEERILLTNQELYDRFSNETKKSIEAVALGKAQYEAYQQQAAQDKENEDYSAFGLGARQGLEMVKSIPDELSVVFNSIAIDDNTQRIKGISQLIDKYGEDFVRPNEKMKGYNSDYKPKTLGQERSELESSNVKRLSNAVKSYKSASERLAKYNRSDIPQSVSNINNISDFGKFAASTLGQTVPQLALTIGTFGTGTFMMETGMIQMQMIDELSQKTGKTPEDIIKNTLANPNYAIAGGLASGSLDLVSLGVVAKSIGLTKLGTKVLSKGAAELAEKKTKKQISKEIAKGVARSAISEGITEPIQGVIEDYSSAKGTGQKYNFDKNKFLTEGLAGVIMGVGMGGSGKLAYNGGKEAIKQSKQYRLETAPSYMLNGQPLTKEAAKDLISKGEIDGMVIHNDHKVEDMLNKQADRMRQTGQEVSIGENQAQKALINEVNKKTTETTDTKKVEDSGKKQQTKKGKKTTTKGKKGSTTSTSNKKLEAEVQGDGNEVAETVSEQTTSTKEQDKNVETKPVEGKKEDKEQSKPVKDKTPQPLKETANTKKHKQKYEEGQEDLEIAEADTEHNTMRVEDAEEELRILKIDKKQLKQSDKYKNADKETKEEMLEEADDYIDGAKEELSDAKSELRASKSGIRRAKNKMDKAQKALDAELKAQQAEVENSKKEEETTNAVSTEVVNKTVEEKSTEVVKGLGDNGSLLQGRKKEVVEKKLGKHQYTEEIDINGGKAIREVYEFGVIETMQTSDGSKIYRLTDLNGDSHGASNMDIVLSGNDINKIFKGKNVFELSDKQINKIFKEKFSNAPKSTEAPTKLPTSSQTKGDSKKSDKKTANQKITDDINSNSTAETKQRETSDPKKGTLPTISIAPLDKDTQKTKKIRSVSQIIENLQRVAGVPFRFRKMKGRILGEYGAAFREIAARSKSDIAVLVHEVGHAMQDRFKLTTTPEAQRALYAKTQIETGELDESGNPVTITHSAYDLHKGGSNPPSKLNAAAAKKYREGEAVAEFFKLWVVSPVETERLYPAFANHFHNTVDSKRKEAFLEIGEDIRALYYAPASKQMIANSSLSEKEKNDYGKWVGKFELANYKSTFWDKVNHQLFNDLGVFNKVVELAAKSVGLDLKDIKNTGLDPRIARSLLDGVNGKLDSIFEDGMAIWGKTDRNSFSNGETMTFENLMSNFDHSSKESLDADKKLSVAWGTAERSIEIADRHFDNVDRAEAKKLGKLADKIAWSMQQNAKDKKSRPHKVAAAFVDAISSQETGQTLSNIEGQIKMANRRVRNAQIALKKAPDSAESKAKLANVVAVKRKLVARRARLNALYTQVLDREIGKYTGAGIGFRSDMDVVRETLFNEVPTLKKEDKARHDNIKESITKYREWSDALMQYAVDGGNMEQRREDKDGNLVGGLDYIKEHNSSYYAMNRIQNSKSNDAWNDSPSAGILAARGVGSTKALIKKAKGSDKELQDPYESLIKNTYDFITETDNNNVKRMFIDLLRTNPRTMEDNIPSVEGKELPPLSSFISDVISEGSGGANNITVNYGGKKVQFNIANQQLFEAFKQINAPKGIFTFLNILKKAIQYTITSTPQFAIRNIIRDFQSRWILGKSSPLTDFQSNKGDIAKLGISGGTQFGFGARDSKKTLDKLTRIALTKQAPVYKKIGASLEKNIFGGGLTAKGENLSRVKEYQAQYKKARKAGLDDFHASMYAASEARGLIDFAKGGRAIKTANQYIPFLNAAVQGLVAMKNSAKKNPVSFATRMVVVNTILATTEMMLLGDDPDDLQAYQQLADYRKDFFVNIRMGDHWFIMPKPFELGLLSSAMTRGYMKSKGDKHAFEGFSGNVLKSFLPLVTESQSWFGGLSPVLEILTNKDLFRDRDVSPEYEKDLLKGLRTRTNDASVLSQKIGDILSVNDKYIVDPQQIDHLLKGYGGYHAKTILSILDFVFDESGAKSDFWMSLFESSSLGKKETVAGARDMAAIYEMDKELKPILRGDKTHTKMMDAIKKSSMIYSSNISDDGFELTREARHELGKSILNMASAYREILEDKKKGYLELSQDNKDLIQEYLIQMNKAGKFK